MKLQIQARIAEQQDKQVYHEPLLLRHEPLRNITGQKYGEKVGGEKTQAES